jgi:Skp family chaperone for outer membrane proteins
MAMDFKKRLLTAFSAMALTIGMFGVPAQAAKARCTSEECACEQALRQNTVEALEEFLKKYPHSVNNKESACAALAVPLDDETSGNQSSDDRRTPVESGDLSPEG